MESSGPTISDTQVAGAFDAALEQADAHRSNSLGVAADLTAARASAHALELERLTAKYGSGSPEAADMTARVALMGVVVATVAAEQQRTQIAPPKIDAHTSAVAGRVIDTSSNGIPNYTVSSLDDQDAVVAYACSDGNGAFELSIVVPQKWYYRELQVQDPTTTCAPPTDAAAKPTTRKGRKPSGPRGAAD
jgi:hypothetical protein